MVRIACTFADDWLFNIWRIIFGSCCFSSAWQMHNISNSFFYSVSQLVNQIFCMTNGKGSAYEVSIYFSKTKMRWENNKRGKRNRKTNVWKKTERTKKDHIIMLEFVIELRVSEYGKKMFNWFKIYKCDVTCPLLIKKSCLRPKHREILRTPCIFVSMHMQFYTFHILFKAYGERH